MATTNNKIKNKKTNKNKQQINKQTATIKT